MKVSFRTRWKSTSSTNKQLGLHWVALAAVAAWPFIFYWRAAVGLGMFYFGDIARFFYPTRLLYAQALQQGRLPFWVPQMLLGFPLFAEMQTGVLYPPHLLLYRFLPIDLAINYDILSHLAWLGVGTYLLARARGISISGSALAALALTAGGFGAGRVTHLSVLAVAAWMPWNLLVYERWRRAVNARATLVRYWAVLALLVGLQFLAGHPQFLLLNLFTLTAYAVANALNWLDGSVLRLEARQVVTALLPLVAVVLGVGLASVQILPTLVLTQASARAGGVTEQFFTDFSYHPYYLALLLDPFLRGNPYPNVSVEVIGYLGVMPLLLAVFAVWAKRDRATIFWLGLALGALVLAFGAYNPVYRYLRFLPLLNFFRVPARFLFPFSLAVAMLAGTGFDALRARSEAQSRVQLSPWSMALIPAALIVLLGMYLEVNLWIQLWQILSPILVVLSLMTFVLFLRGRLGRPALTGVVVGLTLFDLSAFGMVYAQTFNVIAPRSEIFARPRVLDELSLENGARTLTSEWIFPWVSAMRESLYPNLNAAFGASTPAGYTPLIPRLIELVLAQLSPAMLNLFGVRYYLIPQVLPVDAQSEAGDVKDPFNLNPLDGPIDILPTSARGIEVESALAQSVNLRDGDVVAMIHVTTDDGQTISVPLRAGLDTAEWAYERSDVRRAVQHSEPAIASTFPARSAFPIEAHPGHTFRADLPISSVPLTITRIAVEPKFPAGLVHIQTLGLTEGNTLIPLAPMLGKASHKLIYRSEDVAVYENTDYAPRAFIAHSAFVVSDDEALRELQSPDYSGELLLADGAELNTDVGAGEDEGATIISYEPERVVLDVQADFDGYVVLTDAWDEGWAAFVDGEPAPIHRADVVLRAVRVPGGRHRVEFVYRPRSVFVGAALSGASLALLGIIVLGSNLLFSRRTRRPVI